MTPYQYGANNPIVYIDVNGDSLKVTNDAIMAIYHSLDKNSNVHFDVKNGMINPESFKEQAENSNDIVLKDLYEVSINKQIVEMSVAANYDYKDKNGEIRNSDDKGDLRRFNAPYDYNTNEDPLVENTLKRFGEPTGKTFIGNTGRTLFPGNNSTTGANSTNDNIQIILNAKGNANHRAAGSAHELVHVILHFRSGGNIFQHGQPGVQSEIDKRSSIVIKRLGYDFY
jgi:hypothetical protein